MESDLLLRLGQFLSETISLGQVPDISDETHSGAAGYLLDGQLDRKFRTVRMNREGFELDSEDASHPRLQVALEASLMRSTETLGDQDTRHGSPDRIGCRESIEGLGGGIEHLDRIRRPNHHDGICREIQAPLKLLIFFFQREILCDLGIARSGQIHRGAGHQPGYDGSESRTERDGENLVHRQHCRVVRVFLGDGQLSGEDPEAQHRENAARACQVGDPRTQQETPKERHDEKPDRVGGSDSALVVGWNESDRHTRNHEKSGANLSRLGEPNDCRRKHEADEAKNESPATNRIQLHMGRGVEVANAQGYGRRPRNNMNESTLQIGAENSVQCCSLRLRLGGAQF